MLSKLFKNIKRSFSNSNKEIVKNINERFGNHFISTDINLDDIETELNHTFYSMMLGGDSFGDMVKYLDAVNKKYSFNISIDSHLKLHNIPTLYDIRIFKINNIKKKIQDNK